MASNTIRNIEGDVKTRLRRPAAGHGNSMERQAGLISAEAVARETAPQKGLGTAIQPLFKPFGGVELHLPLRPAIGDPQGSIEPQSWSGDRARHQCRLEAYAQPARPGGGGVA